MRILLTVLLAWLLAASAFAAETEVVDTGRVNARLVSSHDMVEPGQTFSVALLTELDAGWHTYWRNPGDSGEPVQITWELPDGAEAGDIYWPVPSPVPTGPIINYGFEGAPLFPVTLTAPQAMGAWTVEADVYYLVCKDICIPESTVLRLDLVVGGTAIGDPIWGPRIRDAIEASPRRGELSAGARLEGGTVIIDVAGAQNLMGAYLFPYENWVIDHSAEQTVQRADGGVRFGQVAGFGWAEDSVEAFDALVAYDGPLGRRAEVVRVEPNISVPIGAVTAAPITDAPLSGTGVTLIGALLGAVFGGLILNLMPCVFPVISIKALSLARSAHGERAKVRVEAWLYTLGVVVTMLALAILIIALKAGGAALGWGFQLQSPLVVGALALLTFLIGLNLLGAFEIGGRLQNAGQGLTEGGGKRGAFFTGMLAVIVATPCTAPFMAGAVGYALAQSAPATLLIFGALALGFAAPFLLLAYLPGMLAKLPRPGPWMETFRQVLAFPMFATAIWLVWVLTNQTGSMGMVVILLSALGMAFAVWLIRRKPLAGRVALVACLVGGIVMLRPLSGGAVVTSDIEISESAWSAEAVAAERAQGRTVFVDFTADWCVTCKVNERLVLSKPDMQQIFAETDTAFLVADWTNKNDDIARELERFGRAGIPLYLVYPPGHDDVSPMILPQILTRSVVEDALRGARQTRSKT